MTDEDVARAHDLLAHDDISEDMRHAAYEVLIRAAEVRRIVIDASMCVIVYKGAPWGEEGEKSINILDAPFGAFDDPEAEVHEVHLNLDTARKLHHTLGVLLAFLDAIPNDAD